MSSYRKERLEKEILRQISESVAYSVKDPKIGMITVTRVEVSRDYSFAKVFVTSMGSKDELAKSMQGLNRARAYIQGQVRRNLSIQKDIEIKFYEDKGIDNVLKVDEILSNLGKLKKEDEDCETINDREEE